METRLRTEMTRLNEELRHLDTVKAEYRKSFVAFAEDAVFLNSALAKARADVAALEPELAGDPQRRHDLRDKLQSLESRALAVEGTLSKLPADQLVIRQLQNAGVATLQELATTMASRFASIKMTLLTIHGARMVQDLQRLGQQGADLDRNLNRVRSILMQDAVQNAATAPGNNRLAQAQQLQSVVADTQNLVALVDAARDTNQRKFDEARALMAQAREDMLTLGKGLNPAATVAAQSYTLTR
jgi:chromosome segregation ATPase